MMAPPLYSDMHRQYNFFEFSGIFLKLPVRGDLFSSPELSKSAEFNPMLSLLFLFEPTNLPPLDFPLEPPDYFCFLEKKEGPPYFDYEF